jgi:hypothetical protein
VGLTAGLDVLENRKIFPPARNGTIDRPAHSRLTLPTQLSRLRHVFVSRLDCKLVEDVSFLRAKNRQNLRKF